MAVRVGSMASAGSAVQVLKRFAICTPKPGSGGFNDVGDLKTMPTSQVRLQLRPFNGPWSREDELIIDGKSQRIQRDGSRQIPWGEQGVQIVIESTGLFRSKGRVNRREDRQGAETTSPGEAPRRSSSRSGGSGTDDRDGA